jgi:formylglycine-generating enzyme required for sulfatase activity
VNSDEAAAMIMTMPCRSVVMILAAVVLLRAACNGENNTQAALPREHSPKPPSPLEPSANKQLSLERPRLWSLDLGDGARIEFVLIPAGSFLMGDADGGGSEKPVHKVNITKPFYLGKYPVTQRQWEAVMGNNPSRFHGPQNPVENVSWEDCQAFLEQLNRKFARSGEKFRLPTEAQWEYACRAGGTGKYGFGDDAAKLGECAWFEGNSGRRTHPVGERKPNAWGLYDMLGNVWQWCADKHDWGYYSRSPADDPPGGDRGNARVLRGGCWDTIAADCRAGFRDLDGPQSRNLASGLRVACPIAAQ